MSRPDVLDTGTSVLTAGSRSRPHVETATDPRPPLGAAPARFAARRSAIRTR
ncbi:hypothetical protein [Streptomyces sp. NPDC095613]|uniref:hypothetical protein n=1 Tax=Streptomyces sp. NPDC095613 TaxID=3155540 RepID=UPI0033196EAD